MGHLPTREAAAFSEGKRSRPCPVRRLEHPQRSRRCRRTSRRRPRESPTCRRRPCRCLRESRRCRWKPRRYQRTSRRRRRKPRRCRRRGRGYRWKARHRRREDQNCQPSDRQPVGRLPAEGVKVVICRWGTRKGSLHRRLTGRNESNRGPQHAKATRTSGLSPLQAQRSSFGSGSPSRLWRPKGSSFLSPGQRPGLERCVGNAA